MSTHKKKTNIVKMTSQEGPTQNHSSKVNIKMITQKVFRDIKLKELEKLLF